MTTVIDELEQQEMARLTGDNGIPDFTAGDTVKVHTRVREGERQRIQIYEGVVIARKNDALNSSFTVRKISFGEGVERVFPLYSPLVARIEVVRRGEVRRAKLYYLRDRRGRSARITEDKAATAKARAREQAIVEAERQAAKAAAEAAKAEKAEG